MFLTTLDAIFVVVILFSAFLAMVRGFSREVLSLLSWFIGALVAYFLYKPLLPFVAPYISHKMIAVFVTIAIIFIVVFLLVTIITVKISDMILDSKLGLIDRTLGFIFGCMRGFFIMVIAMLLVNQLIKPEEQSAWLKEAKTKPLLDSVSNDIWHILPKDVDQYFDKLSTITKKNDTIENSIDQANETQTQPQE